MRKLATLRTVKELVPIEKADFIELALVDGWQCVVKKGEFKEGDLGIYFEIDSFLPIDERYEFLRKSCYKKLVDGKEGFRLRTIRLKKTLSQGLILPLKQFPEIKNPQEGIDYSEVLGVTKYDPPLPAHFSGKIKGNFPAWLPKTDQERIQNIPEYFKDYKQMTFEVTEKLDGSSMTVYLNEDQFGVCSKNLELYEDDTNVFWRTANELDLKQSLKKLGRNIALQGEIVGPGIQKNPHNLNKVNYRIFDIYDIDKKRYMTPLERRQIVIKLMAIKLDIDHVPTIDVNNRIFVKCKNVDEILEYVKGKMMYNDKRDREGCVFKAHNLVGNEIVSFKVINNDYL